MTKKIAYLGPKGSFTYEALTSQDALGEHSHVEYKKLSHVLDVVSSGETDFGFIPIENAIEGTVNMTLDALAFDHDLVIQNEVELDIHLNLLALAGTKKSDIKVISSHPVANAQCIKYCEENFPDLEIGLANSTSEAAQIASTSVAMAAFAPLACADIYGLEVLEENIEDFAGNKTRFVLVSQNGIPAMTGKDKSTVIIGEREDKPGSLVAILQEFAARTINLSRLTSRPIKNQLGQYCFVIDFYGHIGDDVVANCLTSIQAKHADVKFLGSYPTVDANATDVARKGSSWEESERWMYDLQSQIEDLS